MKRENLVLCGDGKILESSRLKHSTLLVQWLNTFAHSYFILITSSIPYIQPNSIFNLSPILHFNSFIVSHSASRFGPILSEADYLWNHLHVHLVTIMASLACCEPFENQGEPQGKLEEFNGIKTYVAPTSTGTPEYAIVLLTDIFAISNNVKLLADRYAKKHPSLLVVVPDYLPGGAIDTSVYPSVVTLMAPKPTDSFWGKCSAGTITIIILSET